MKINIKKIRNGIKISRGKSAAPAMNDHDHDNERRQGITKQKKLDDMKWLNDKEIKRK